MVNFMYAQINIISIFILLIMFFNIISRRFGRKTVDQRIFMWLIVANIVACIVDTGMWLLNGMVFTSAREINIFVTYFYYLLNPFVCFLWLAYTDYKLYENKVRLRKKIFIYFLPCGISSLLATASIFTGWYFVIDDLNAYSRGEFFWIMALLSFCYLAYSMYLAVKDYCSNRSSRLLGEKWFYLCLMIFPLALLFVSILQTILIERILAEHELPFLTSARVKSTSPLKLSTSEGILLEEKQIIIPDIYRVHHFNVNSEAGGTVVMDFSLKQGEKVFLLSWADASVFLLIAREI